MTMRELAEKSGGAKKIDDYSVSWGGRQYVEVFWDLRGFYGHDAAITPRILADYCADRGVLLDRNERDIIYQMDRAFRSAMGARKAENDKRIADRVKSKGK